MSSSIAKINAFNSLKDFFKNVFSDDIEDENSGLDKYINNQSNDIESIENAKIATELQKSLKTIELSYEELETPKTKGKLSISKKKLVNPEKTSKIQNIKKDKDDKDYLSK